MVTEDQMYTKELFTFEKNIFWCLKKSLFIIILITLASCSTVKEKTSGIKEMGSIGKECPPKNERTLKHIFCKEPK